MTINLDFETRSEAPLLKTGAYKYAADPSTEVLCLGYSIGDAPVQLWLPGEHMPEALRAEIAKGATVMAFNAFFEKCIWRHVMVKKHGWPDIPDGQWSCSASLARAHALPGDLGRVGLALKLDIQKSEEGKRVMMKLAKPRTPTKSNPSIWHENWDDFRKLYAYCVDDVGAERAIHKRLPRLTPTEHKIWMLDQKINERGIRVDMPAIKNAIQYMAIYGDKLTKELVAITKGEVETAFQRDRILAWTLKQGVSLNGMTKNDLLDALDPAKAAGMPPHVRRVLEIRQAVGKTSTAKYQAIVDAASSDDRVRDLLIYHGASTGRWTGRAVQPQNFPKNTLKGDLETHFEVLKDYDYETYEMCYPDVINTLSSAIRGVFIPSEGATFFGGDYSAIEARVLFWLANEKRGMSMFASGADIYKDLAATIYNVPIDQVSKDQRDMGKRGILGAGYGMGPVKFKATCMDFARVEISEELAERVIAAYRNKYPTVKQLWLAQETAARQAVETKQLVPCGRVKWLVHGDFLYCRLPSGRNLAFHEPRIELMPTSWGEKKPTITYTSINSVTKQWDRTTTYGGKIVENLCQAVARDLMAEAMLRAEAAGYRVILTVHDELLTEKESGDKKEFEQLMAHLPGWAAGCPVKAEAWSAKRYVK